MRIRKRILPSGWYPADEKRCLENFKKFEIMVKPSSINVDLKNVNSIIVPHAGWDFSGHLSYLSFLKAKEVAEKSNQKIDLIVYFGGHLKYSENTIVLNYDYCETPFGNLEVETNLINEYKKLFDSIDETSIFSDNTIEVNMPFIKHFFQSAKFIGLYPPLQEALSIAQFFINKVTNCLVVASSDLTHYGPNYGFTPSGTGEKAYKWACENDKILLNALEKLDYDSIELIVDKHQNSCSPNSLTTAIAYASFKGSKKGYILSYDSSYNIFPSASFVGYLSFIV